MRLFVGLLLLFVGGNPAILAQDSGSGMGVGLGLATPGQASAATGGADLCGSGFVRALAGDHVRESRSGHGEVRLGSETFGSAYFFTICIVAATADEETSPVHRVTVSNTNIVPVPNAYGQLAKLKLKTTLTCGRRVVSTVIKDFANGPQAPFTISFAPTPGEACQFRLDFDEAADGERVNVVHGTRFISLVCIPQRRQPCAR